MIKLFLIIFKLVKCRYIKTKSLGVRARTNGSMFLIIGINPDLVESIFECQKWVRNFVALNYFAICDEYAD